MCERQRERENKIGKRDREEEFEREIGKGRREEIGRDKYEGKEKITAIGKMNDVTLYYPIIKMMRNREKKL